MSRITARSITPEDMIIFIQNTGATIYRTNDSLDKPKWQVCTGFSESLARTLRGALAESMRDHDEAVAEGEADAEWRV